MTTHEHTPQERLWAGEPWCDEFAALLPRPSDAARERIYEAARAGLATPAFARFLRRRWAPLSAWGFSTAAAAVLCVWLAGNGPSGPASPSAADVLATDFLAAVDHYATVEALADEDATAIDDELYTVEQSLAWLEHDVNDDGFARTAYQENGYDSM
ncbi:hypothetical protein GX586_03590 [bacterium]|nr:hypothetical protein [bacterium]